MRETGRGCRGRSQRSGAVSDKALAAVVEEGCCAGCSDTSSDELDEEALHSAVLGSGGYKEGYQGGGN